MRPLGIYWQVPVPVREERWTGGELLAIRGWKLIRWTEDGSVRLASLSRNTVWHGPVFNADAVPLAQPNCGSGVYALKPSCRPRIAPHGCAVVAPYETDWLAGRRAWVWGWVALSGRVVEHQRGYRAQTAAIRRLHLGVMAHAAFQEPEAIGRLVSQLEERYQCPVRTGYWEPRAASAEPDLAHDLRVLLPTFGPRGEIPPSLITAARPAHAQPAAAAPRPLKRPSSAHAVARAFARAEAKLGSKWRLEGRGHCDRVTLRNPYSRFVRHVTTCWSLSHPHGLSNWAYVFPLAVVKHAARSLRVSPEVLIGKRC
ncbi:MAG TPA: hypothetical protein VMI34_21870 [Candidatus Bathyarchaeia archaeon]|nr:hypothetical protein [Candidatus Bathyarchaeia archaeon]